MADLAAANVTITVQKKIIMGKRKRNRVKIVFGDGALTYPTGGVPMPAYGPFGLKRFLEFLDFTDFNDGVATMWKYDQENNKLRGWVTTSGAEVSGAVAAQTFYALAVGW